MNKIFLRYILMHVICYTITCGLAWYWVLDLKFSFWKLPILGAIQAIVFANLHRILLEGKPNGK